MKESMNLYTKAMNYYNKGNLKKAMEFCERSISLNLKNTGAINLKGLLFYIKGELDDARNLWKLNCDMNRDSVAMKYLESSNEDSERLVAYEKALQCIDSYEVKQAIEFLHICSESDFNCLNVLNLKAGCYMKIGEYAKAAECVEKVISMERGNKDALNYKKLLVEFGAAKKDKQKMMLVLSAVASLAVVVVFSVVFIKVSQNRTSRLEEVKDQKQAVKPIETKVKPQEKEIVTNKAAAFPASEIDECIKGKNYETLYNLIELWESKASNVNEKNAINSSKQVMKEEGVAYFYKSGRAFLSNKEYDKAIASFNKAGKYAGGSYLSSHIKYMTGAAYKDKKDIENAIKYYKSYLKENPQGDYEEAALYEISIMLKDIDFTASQGYAEELTKKYPDSQYNNTIIQSIINK